uniref:Protein kinase domain-containing protein n=1 Tax=Leptobrachium leishanense TaxID=445787 RepID=A0A8C5M6A1_9ANUR
MVVVTFWMAMAFIRERYKKWKEKLKEEEVMEEPVILEDQGTVKKKNQRWRRTLKTSRRLLKRKHEQLFLNLLRGSDSYGRNLKRRNVWIEPLFPPMGEKRKAEEPYEGMKKKGKWGDEERAVAVPELQDMSDDFMEFPLTPSDFAFLHLLGYGGFGQVLLASRRDTKQLVAVKVMMKAIVDSNIILRERRTLEIAAESPFLCAGLAAFQTPTLAFLVMPFMLGGNMSHYLKKRGHLETFEATFYSAEIICGILFLHSRGIIHRDIKPENILLDNEGHARIADFGLVAEQITGGATTTGATGTYSYMAPEVKSRKHYGSSADWWSFGVTLYQMLTGDLPFQSESDLLGKCIEVHRCEAKKPDFPEWLSKESVDILSELLEVNPNYRLGVRGNIKEHPFYDDISWIDLEAKTIRPLYQPQTLIRGDLTQGMEEKYFSLLESQTLDSSSDDSQVYISDLSFRSPLWRRSTI